MAKSTEQLQQEKRDKEGYEYAKAEAEKTAEREELLENETDEEQRARRMNEGVS